MAGGVNTYSYALANPIYYSDRTGLVSGPGALLSIVAGTVQCMKSSACRKLVNKVAKWATTATTAATVASGARQCSSSIEEQQKLDANHPDLLKQCVSGNPSVCGEAFKQRDLSAQHDKKLIKDVMGSAKNIHGVISDPSQVGRLP